MEIIRISLIFVELISLQMEGIFKIPSIYESVDFLKTHIHYRIVPPGSIVKVPPLEIVNAKADGLHRFAQ